MIAIACPAARAAAPAPGSTTRRGRPVERQPRCRARATAARRLTAALCLAALAATPPCRAAVGDLGEVIVTAALRPVPALDVAGSVAVLDAPTLRDAGQQHFEDVLALVPNLNWAGDTSRPRYFQLRGIGELEQYQGAPNPSIGFLIDDIDFSGLGSAATMFDIDHVEVLRGPQGTRYGANALGGLIYVASAPPEDAYDARLELGGGDYDTRSIGAVVSGPVPAADSAFRLAAERYTSDGYYHNVYLGRYDTNSREELTLRGRWRYQPSPQLRIDLSVLHVAIDNGYDAFAPDNTRTTHSDHPGVDAQHSTGAAVKLAWTGPGAATLTAIGTVAQTRVRYGYDGDWGNPAYWAPYVDDFTELQLRRRTTASTELRLASAPERGFAWLIGAYAQQLRESFTDTSVGHSNDPVNGPYAQDSVVDSSYRARSYALFGVVDADLAGCLRASLGLRGERRTSSYEDLTSDLIAGQSASNDFRPADRLWGGHAALTCALSPTQTLYLQLARGYKAGGFNLSQGLLPSEILFRPEADLNLEAGYHAELLDRRLRLGASVFRLERRDAQIRSSVQVDPTNPNLFIYYTGNAARGRDYGLEAELRWQATPRLSVGGSLGLLETRFEDFVRIGAAGAARVARELANAPHWQGALNAVFRDPRGPFARVDLTGMGAYYFDLPPNPTRSHPYGLVNSRLGWESARWSAYLWGRNLLDRNYPVRGFYFGLEPPNYPDKLYLQLGDPRSVGANLVMRFGSSAR